MRGGLRGGLIILTRKSLLVIRIVLLLDGGSPPTVGSLFIIQMLVVSQIPDLAFGRRSRVEYPICGAGAYGSPAQ